MFDKEFGLYYVRTRYLDPTNGRFTGPDLAGYVDGMNRFQSYRSSPMQLRDPSGLGIEVARIADYKGFSDQMDEWFFKNMATFIATLQGPSTRLEGNNLPPELSAVLRQHAEAIAHDKLFLGYAATASTFWPGKEGSGNNRFIYTCRCGWIDVGHFFTSAAMARGLRILFTRMGIPNAPASARLATYAYGYGVELLQLSARLYSGTNTPEDRLVALIHSTFMDPNALDGGLMDDDKRTNDGWSISAFTLEDLPSDWYGSGFGAYATGLGQVRTNWKDPRNWGDMATWKGAVRENIKQTFKSFLTGCGVVALSNRLPDGRTAYDVLHSDAVNIQDSIAAHANAGVRSGNRGLNSPQVPGKLPPSQLYNRTNRPINTPSHDCVCGKNGNPIGGP